MTRLKIRVIPRLFAFQKLFSPSTLPPAPRQRNQHTQEQEMFKDGKSAAIMGGVPVADRTMKARLPIKGEKDKGTVIIVQWNVNRGVERTGAAQPKERATPLPSSQPSPITEPNISKHQEGRMKKIVYSFHPRLIKEQILE